MPAPRPPRAGTAMAAATAAGDAAAPIDDAVLRDYLADALSPEDSARVEKALRDSAELRARLEDVRQNRADCAAPHAGRHLAPRPADLPQPAAARQLPARRPRSRAGRLHPVPPRRHRVPVLPGQPRRPQGPVAGPRRRQGLQDPAAPHPPVQPASARRGQALSGRSADFRADRPCVDVNRARPDPYSLSVVPLLTGCFRFAISLMHLS